MSEPAKGILAIVGACAVWGMSAIFFKALAHVPPLEILAHRVLWTAAFFGAVIALQGRGGDMRAVIAAPRVRRALALAAGLIATHWLCFIHAVHAGRALEASLGYYVFPLVAIALGYVALGERYSRAQTGAIALAVLAVLVLWAGLGAPPWIALLLAVTFAGYGLLKNRVGLGPVLGVAFETGLLAPVALVWLGGLHAGLWIDPGGRAGALFASDAWTAALLLLSGPLMTGLPLILFSYAARRVRLATLGLVQYMNPTLQFLVAVIIFGEVFTRWHAVAFPLIWIGLALYSRESWRGARTSASRAASAGTLR